MMKKEHSDPTRPSPERLAILRGLPKEILQSLTKQEIQALLHDDEWPDSLREKLKEFEKEE